MNAFDASPEVRRSTAEAIGPGAVRIHYPDGNFLDTDTCQARLVAQSRDCLGQTEFAKAILAAVEKAVA